MLLLAQIARVLLDPNVEDCIAAHNAGLMHPAVHRLHAAGFTIDDADISHAGPTMSEHILVHGRYRYNPNRPPQQLRPPAPTPRS